MDWLTTLQINKVKTSSKWLVSFQETLTCSWQSSNLVPGHQFHIQHTTHHGPAAQSCILVHHTHLKPNQQEYFDFQLMTEELDSLSITWNLVMFQYQRLAYLRRRTGMRSGWHRLPRKQDRPLTQLSSVLTHFRSLHPHSQCQSQQLWYRQIYKFLATTHDISNMVKSSIISSYAKTSILEFNLNYICWLFDKYLHQVTLL